MYAVTVTMENMMHPLDRPTEAQVISIRENDKLLKKIGIILLFWPELVNGVIRITHAKTI